jgi:hypothetical protein
MDKINGVLRAGLLLTSLVWPLAGVMGQDNSILRELEAYKWKNRLLLVFSPSSEHESYRQQLLDWQGQDQQFDDRDLVVLAVVGERPLQPESLSALSPYTLRRHFLVDQEDFAVLLVGKDGTLKSRSALPLTAGQVYAIIDGMPMRRTEMRKKR